MEFGSEVVAHCEREAVVAAKENAGVEVVNMSTPYGRWSVASICNDSV